MEKIHGLCIEEVEMVVEEWRRQMFSLRNKEQKKEMFFKVYFNVY